MLTIRHVWYLAATSILAAAASVGAAVHAHRDAESVRGQLTAVIERIQFLELVQENPSPTPELRRRIEFLERRMGMMMAPIPSPSVRR